MGMLETWELVAWILSASAPEAAEGRAPAQRQSGRGMSPFLALCSTQAQTDEAVSLTQSAGLNVYLVQKTPRIIVNQVSRHTSGDDT